MADVPGPRKRTSSDQDSTTPHATTGLDETSPIANDTASVTKDYNSISPTISPRDHLSPTPNIKSDTAPAQASPPLSDSTSTTSTRRASAEREAAAVEQRDRSRWRTFWDKYGSVELENKGSVARDHLALERTFLAWLRTSLSFASIGIAITQLFRLNTNLSNPSQHHKAASFAQQDATTDEIHTSNFIDALSPEAKLRHLGKPLGATFIAISVVMLLIGFHRYFEAQHYVIRGKFPASRGSIIAVSVIAGTLILTSLLVILITAPNTFEK